jgi:hypothetical protein
MSEKRERLRADLEERRVRMSTDPASMPEQQAKDLERIRLLMSFGTIDEVIVFINERFIQLYFLLTVHDYEKLEEMDREDLVDWISKSLIAALKSEEQSSPPEDTYQKVPSTPDGLSVTTSASPSILTPGSSTPTSPSISIVTPDSPSISTSHSPQISTPGSSSLEAPRSGTHHEFGWFSRLTFRQAEEHYQLPPGTTMSKWTVQMLYVLLYLVRYQLGLPDST